MWIASLSRFSILWTGTLALGVWSTASETGAFSLANRIALLTGVLLGALNATLGPRMAALDSDGRRCEAWRLVRAGACALILLGSFPFAIRFFRPELLLGWFGEAFANYGPVLSILALGQAANLASGPANEFLVMTGNGSVVRCTVVWASFLHLLGCGVAAPALGAVGVAAVTALAVAGQNTAAFIIARRAATPAVATGLAPRPTSPESEVVLG